MLSSIIWIKFLWIITIFYLVAAIPHTIKINDKINELNNDDAIFNAVIESMKEWKIKYDSKINSNRSKREEPSVCYEKLGCFDASGPFGYLDMLPSKPEEINTRFLLYPARNRQRRSSSAPTEVPFENLNDAFQWAKEGFNKTLPTKVLIHGFGSDCGYIWAYEVRSALMAVEEVNTICVDWSNGAALPNYVKASANTRLVGKQLSLLLRGLVEKNELSLMSTHLIGFSLGAHIAGFAGADLGNLSRITGLDPAGPLFESQDTRARLDETDASFVDVIHSNGENLILGGLGSSQPMGHVDFYPNGGRMQKGCSHLFVGAVSDIIWSSAVEGRSLCNHRRAYKFFIDSVSPRCHFPAFPCDSHDNFLLGKCFPCTDERKCGNMGYYADKSKGRGQLYLITREEEPFCAHQYLVQIDTPSSPFPIKSYGKIEVTLIGDSFLNETFLLTRKDDEELNSSDSISKIVVLHPILSQPSKMEILYTAYSGWLSSGLTYWKINKVLLMDSFGKISSFCKKNIILESGIPLTLELNPRDCGPLINNTEMENKIDLHIEEDNDTFTIPNTINKDDIEAESSRAFNSRIIRTKDKLNNNDGGIMREVVEPILKTNPVKNGRSYDTENKKHEVFEPVLSATNRPNNIRPSFTTEDDHHQWRNEAEYNKEHENLIRPSHQSTLSNNNPLNSIVSTVQFLPQRIAKMFERAEKYARETIFPLVSTVTPRFISEFMGVRDEPKYIPLNYGTTTDIPKEREESFNGRQFMDIKITPSPPPPPPEELIDVAQSQLAIVEEEKEKDDTTPYSHIQRIISKKKNANEDEGNQTNNNQNNLERTHFINTYSSSSSSSNNTTDQKFNFNVDFDIKNKSNSASGDENNLTFMQTIAHNLQNIPDNFARMVSQVQHYTRTNILPLVQTYSPRRLTDLVWIRPNSTIKVDKKATNNGKMQENNISFTWSISKDFTTPKSKDFSIDGTTLKVLPYPLTSTLKSVTKENSTTSPRVETPLEKVFMQISSTSSPRSNSSKIEVFQTTSVVPEKLNYTLSSNNIQKIPRRGEKLELNLPSPFTILIDPRDLTTQSTTTIPAKTTTKIVRKVKKFESYIQKIPKKNKKSGFKVYSRMYPAWIRDLKIGKKIVPLQSRYGYEINYKIDADGKFYL